MRKHFGKIFLTVLLVTVMAMAAQAADLAQTHEMKNGVSVKYPAAWQVTENTQGPTTALIMMDPAAPGFGVVVTVTEGTPEGAMTMTEEQAKAAFSQMGSDFKMLTFEKTKLADKDATLMEYTFKANDIPMQNRQIMGSVGSKGIVITTSFVDMSKLDELHKIVEAVEGSLTVK